MRGELIEDLADAVPQVVDCSFGGFSQQSLEPGEHHFDWIEVGRVGRQVKQPCAGGFDDCAHAADFMGRQIVHDNGVALSQGGRQALLQPGHEDRAVHRAIDNEGRCDGIIAQSSHKSCRFPVTMRHVADQPPPLFAAAPQPRHLSVCPGFIDKNQLVGIKRRLRLFPFVARPGDVCPVLLAGAHAFF